MSFEYSIEDCDFDPREPTDKDDFKTIKVRADVPYVSNGKLVEEVVLSCIPSAVNPQEWVKMQLHLYRPPIPVGPPCSTLANPAHRGMTGRDYSVARSTKSFKVSRVMHQ